MYTTIKLTEGRYTSLQLCKVLMEILCLPRRRVYLSNLQKLLANSKDTCWVYGESNPYAMLICGGFLFCKVYFHTPQKRLALHVLLTTSWFCIHLRVSSQRFIQLCLDQQSTSTKGCSSSCLTLFAPHFIFRFFVSSQSILKIIFCYMPIQKEASDSVQRFIKSSCRRYHPVLHRSFHVACLLFMYA